MANIEDLIAHIPDERLRKAIAAEVKALKRTKKFGLVFEEHLPETARLPNLPVQPGELVALKRERGNDLWRVTSVRKQVASCRRAIEGHPPEAETSREIPLDELVVVRSFGDPIYPALVPVDTVERGGPDRPWHLLINADNYHALQLLLYAYEGKVDVIYIDPPYNKGARDWKYNNDYVDATDQWRHSKWLAMMKRRIVLAKRLLKTDGILIITIDENEVHTLGMLLAEVFPEYLRHMLTIVINPKGTGKLNVARMDEYGIFCVPQTGTSLMSGNLIPFLSRIDDSAEESEEPNGTAPEQVELVAAPLGHFPFPAEETDQWELRHARRRGNESSYRHQRPNQFYAIYIDPEARRVVRVGESLPPDAKPSMSKDHGLTPIWPIDDEGNHRCWRFIPETMRRHVEEGRVALGRYNRHRHTWTLNIWERKPTSKKVKSVWWSSRHDAGTHGTTLLHKILGRRDAFPFPKSVYAVHDALSTVCGNRPEALIVDFFAGSGTTFHATALLNSEDGGRRRCILVTNNELSEFTMRQMNSEGYFLGDPEYERHGVCESVTWPRCKYVTNGKRDDGAELSGAYINGREMREGFEENMAYFHLDFLDPAEVARGDAFQAISPILWMMGGCVGSREASKGSQAWFIPKNSPFAVLLREKEFQAFRKKLDERQDIELVFLVTDSEENFALMRRDLRHGVKCVQLYKSYLENFRINIAESLREHTP